MLRAATRTLTRSDDTGGVLVVGGLLTLLAWTVTPAWIGVVPYVPPLIALAPLALAPAFIARGYYVRVLADAAETENADGSPPFVAWNDLYRDGVKSALLSAVLLLPLALAFALVALSAGVVGSGRVDATPIVTAIEGALGDDGVAAVVGIGSALLTVVTLAYLVAFAYVRPAALAAFAATGRLRDGLRPGRIAAVATSSEYATVWIVAIATIAAGYAIAAPFVPVLVGVVFVFVVRVIVHALYGRGTITALADAEAVPTVGEPDAISMVTAFDRPTAATPTAGEPAAAASGRTGAIPGVEEFDGAPRRRLAEVPPAVQTGRTVRLGDERVVGADGGGIAATETGRRDGDDGGFEWNSGFDDGLGSDGLGDPDGTGAPNRAAGTEPEADEDTGFEWWAGGDDREDKS